MLDETQVRKRPARIAAGSTMARIPLGLFWVVLGVIVFIFATYEIVERSWLTGTDAKIIHLLHLARGIGTCIIVALIVAWYILRLSPSIFPSELVDGGLVTDEDLAEETRSAHFAVWFIRMRWLACIMGAALTIVAINVLQYLESGALVPLSVLILALVASNLVYDQMLRHNLGLRHLAEIQIGSDLVILTAMLHFSGGVENPMSIAYIFHIIIGGILLDWRKCYAIVFAACTLFSGLALAEMLGYVRHYALLIFPHGIARYTVESSKYDRLRELLGSGTDASSGFHVSHDPVYVISMLILQIVLMLVTAYFIVTIMEQLRLGERNQQAVRQRLERVVQATGAGFTILDRDLSPVWQNDQIKEWLDLNAVDEREWAGILEKWSGNDGGSAAATLEDGKVRAVERAVAGPDGSKRFYQTTIAPLTDREGEVFQIVELTQDITERKIMEAESIHTGKMASLGLMAAGIAHEVGNPLASISTRLRLLEQEPQEEFLKESLPLLKQQIDRIGRIVRDISSFSRAVKNELSVCHVNAILSEVLTILRFHGQPETVHIGTELADNLPDIMAVKDQLTSLFLNLGLNALEAMEQGGSLTITTVAAKEEIHVVFADTGPGISEEILPRLFTPFFSGKKNGLGLGLSIAQRIVATHKGRITAANSPEGGAVFTVVLPRANGA